MRAYDHPRGACARRCGATPPRGYCDRAVRAAEPQPVRLLAMHALGLSSEGAGLRGMAESRQARSDARAARTRDGRAVGSATPKLACKEARATLRANARADLS